ncbi:MAG: transporter [Cryobacterium sp.]|nr:transporter [Cryobacterium sp.]
MSGAVFLSVTAEMLPTGLLPGMSGDLGVSQSQIGLLVTWFAFTVVATSTSLNHLTRRFPRHGLIVAVIAVLAISNVLTALAPGYGLLVVARVIGGLAHGLFWSVVGAYAAHLVPKEQIGRAVSITIAGGTLAFVFGVPLATAAGQLLGWRLSFLMVAGLMLASAVLVWRFLPPVDHYGSRSASEQADAAAPRTKTRNRSRRDATVGAVTLVCLTTALIMTGHYTFYTYIAPFLIEGIGVSLDAVAPLLFAYGVAGAVGLVASGTVFGRRPQRGLVFSLAAAAVGVSGLALFSANAPVAIAAFVLWGLAFGVLPPLLQTRLLHAASPRIRDAASAFYTTAFNMGIGGGALLGAVLLDLVGLAVIPYVYVGILVGALVLVIVSGRSVRFARR